MRARAVFFNAIAVLTTPLVSTNYTNISMQYWPQWRGPLCTGVAPLADPPLRWSETNNIKWKAPIPGDGNSTPIVWSNKVFILTAAPAGKEPGGKAEAPDQPYQFIVLCYDRQTGALLWQKVARQEIPHEGHQENNTYASASPVTDGKVVCAYFGSYGLHCFDMNGNLKWRSDFGKMRTKNGFGEGASPALYGDTLVVSWDQEGPGFIMAMNKDTGKEIWHQARDEGTGWTTPLIVPYKTHQLAIVNASKKIRAYDLANGKEIWECAGMTANAIPTPVASSDTVYVTSGFRGSALLAIKLGFAGELTGTDAILWSQGRDTPYVPSPLLMENLLYIMSGNDGIISCFDSVNGQAEYEHERLEELHAVYSSPVAAKDRIYVLSREGVCAVLKYGFKLDVLAVNKLNDPTDASPAIVGNEIFIRSHHALYCIAEPPSPAAPTARQVSQSK